MDNFKPLLAHTIKNIEDVQIPVMISPKIDGIRCVITKNGVLSRSLKPIRNKHVVETLSKLCELLPSSTIIDGELVCLNNKGKIAPFTDTSSGIMSVEGVPDFVYLAFDYIETDNPEIPFRERFKQLESFIGSIASEEAPVTCVPHWIVTSTKEASVAYDQIMKSDYEGAMFRDPDGRYKYGRSTIKDRILGKFKPFQDSEFKIIGYTQEFRNHNEATKDELGHTKRSTRRDNLEPLESLGSITVTDGNITFEVGSGFTKEQRENFWLTRDELIGKIVTVKYMEYGSKEKPRHPVFKGIREDL